MYFVFFNILYMYFVFFIYFIYVFCIFIHFIYVFCIFYTFYICILYFLYILYMYFVYMYICIFLTSSRYRRPRRQPPRSTTLASGPLPPTGHSPKGPFPKQSIYVCDENPRTETRASRYFHTVAPFLQFKGFMLLKIAACWRSRPSRDPPPAPRRCIAPSARAPTPRWSRGPRSAGAPARHGASLQRNGGFSPEKSVGSEVSCNVPRRRRLNAGCQRRSLRRRPSPALPCRYLLSSSSSPTLASRLLDIDAFANLQAKHPKFVEIAPNLCQKR